LEYMLKSISGWMLLKHIVLHSLLRY
jgi:hypothetical protein